MRDFTAMIFETQLILIGQIRDVFQLILPTLKNIIYSVSYVLTLTEMCPLHPGVDLRGIPS